MMLKGILEHEGMGSMGGRETDKEGKLCISKKKEETLKAMIIQEMIQHLKRELKDEKKLRKEIRETIKWKWEDKKFDDVIKKQEEIAEAHIKKEAKANKKEEL